MDEIFDLIVIGGGPGGYTCSIKAAQLGCKVACIDSRASLGGTCLNEGCIPSKTLLHSSYLYYALLNDKFGSFGVETSGIKLNFDAMMNNKLRVVKNLAAGIDFLFKKNNINRFCGIAKIISYEGEVKTVKVTGKDSVTLSGKNIVIATGSKAVELPGINFDGDKVISSTEALSLEQIPQTMVVIGGGVIGLEMSSIWSRLGTKVTVVEYSNDLAPFLDVEVARYMQKALEKQNIKFLLGKKVVSVSLQQSGAEISYEDTKSSKVEKLFVDKVMISIGRKPYCENIGAPIKFDHRGFIEVNKHFETNIKSVYAIGDVINGPMLAHKAENEAEVVAEIIMGKKFHHKPFIPSVIYTHPEVACVGKTEQDLIKSKDKYNIGKVPFVANSRAVAVSETDGFVKVLTNQFDTIIGVHIVSSNASALISEAVIAMEYGASAEDICKIVHSHPDFAEAFREACMMASYGKALNF